MFNRFKQHLDYLSCLKSNPKVLVCVSGGVDSMVLTRLMLELEYPMGIAHVDHNTRNGDSKADRDFVKEYAEQYEIAFHECNLTINSDNGNFHDLAHRARHEFFLSLPYDLVFTAHHADDVVETILINILNGRSLEGIINHGKFVRPLLPFTKNEILQYASENKIDYRTDSSNLKNKYLRNVIRNSVRPALDEFMPDYSTKVVKLAGRTSEDSSLLTELVDRDKNQLIESSSPISCYKVKLEFLRSISAIHLYHFLRKFGLNRSQAVILKQLCHSDHNKGKTMLASSYQMVIGKDHLVIKELKSHLDQVPMPCQAYTVSDLPDEIDFNADRFKIEKSFSLDRPANVDELLLNPTDFDKSLTVRTWIKGDKIRPIGMNGLTKSLKKIFADAKLDLLHKQEVPIFLIDDKIVWVYGLAVADSQKLASGNHTNLVRISISV